MSISLNVLYLLVLIIVVEFIKIKSILPYLKSLYNCSELEFINSIVIPGYNFLYSIIVFFKMFLVTDSPAPIFNIPT